MEEPVPAGMEVPRVLGRVEGRTAGPTLVCVGGLHGNEPAGIHALHRVLPSLEERRASIRGRFVALAGNLAALRDRRRFVVRDLNRAWTPERLRALARGDGSAMTGSEDREQRELLGAIAEAVEGSRGPVYFLDLHTTSGSGGPFTTVADTLPNRSFALAFPVPLILGLEELVDGTLLEHLGDRGFVSAVFESGQHEEPRAVDRAEAAVLIAVVETGLLREADVPGVVDARKLLRGDTRRLPRVLEMRHRHPVDARDGFRMEPGYENFQRVRRGEPLARDRGGEVVAPESARILMPLYQTQGHDGFFVVREFRPFWLHLSTGLRRLRLASVVHWLPGIRKVPGRTDAVVVDRRIARWYALQLLHLLGFRKHLEHGDELVVVRRRFDRAPAPGVELTAGSLRDGVTAGATSDGAEGDAPASGASRRVDGDGPPETHAPAGRGRPGGTDRGEEA
ncbi:MAG: succinylglutamate desuccinylase/aspartoacylase family protein [Gemmatimonadota bacterium]|jgi:succinylglutamate desuccinylase